jgi:hypothetical protein
MHPWKGRPERPECIQVGRNTPPPPRIFTLKWKPESVAKRQKYRSPLKCTFVREARRQAGRNPFPKCSPVKRGHDARRQGPLLVNSTLKKVAGRIVDRSPLPLKNAAL